MKNRSITEFIKSNHAWQSEISELQRICLDAGLKEEIKWGKPTYTSEGKNIAIIQPFKHYCALMFFKGALLKDPESLLIQLSETAQAQRQFRFTEATQILEMEPIIKAYLQEAVENEKAGLEVQFRNTEDFPVPQELQDRFEEMPAFQEAFEALTPGRQRGYLLYFTKAKQSKTRTARIEKHLPLIFEGKGINDR